MLEQVSGPSSPHQNRGVGGGRFRVSSVAPLFTRSQFFTFLSVTKLKNSNVLDPIGNEDSSHNAFLMHVKQLTTVLAPLKGATVCDETSLLVH